MDEPQKQQVRQIALEEIKYFMLKKQYNLSMIPNHEHSGSDTSQIRGENIDIRTGGLKFKPATSLTVTPKAGNMVFYGGTWYVCEVDGVWKSIVTA